MKRKTTQELKKLESKLKDRLSRFDWLLLKCCLKHKLGTLSNKIIHIKKRKV